MGFYPYMKGDIERNPPGHRGYILARVYYSPLAKWTTREFPEKDLAGALEWIREKLSQVDM